MSNKEDLASFLDYILSSNHKYIKAFSARTALLAKPPSFIRTLPLGSVIVYPGFIIFLTLNTNSPGYSLLFKEVYEKVNAFRTIVEWMTDPSSLIEFLFDNLPKGFAQKSDIEKIFSNPNSLFIPLKRVVSVMPSFSFSQGHSISIKTSDRSLVICQDALIEQQEDYFGSALKMLNPTMYQAGKWHSDVVQNLANRIR